MAVQNKTNTFDLDFSYGSEGELLVNELLTGGKKVEVKRDRKWKSTGRLYIEVWCKSTVSNQFEPSGLSTTTADYWAFVIEETVLIVPTEVLKEVVKKYGWVASMNTSVNETKGYLISVDNIMKAISTT